MNSKRQAALISLEGKLKAKKDKEFSKQRKTAENSGPKPLRLKGSAFTLWAGNEIGEKSFADSMGVLSIALPGKETEVYFVR